MSNPQLNANEIQFQVLGPLDVDEVSAFAEARLAIAIPDPTERTFASWSAKWRKEALEHYLKLGWSFIARHELAGAAGPGRRVVGFFMAQPFLFYRGQTQTLWVEHIEAETAEVRKALTDVAVRVAREKHLQRVLFADAAQLEDDLHAWHPAPLKDDICEVKTTKG